VEHLAERFSARGHEVTVYCRPHMTERRETYAGARLVHLPTIRSKHLDTLAHTLVSTGHMIARARPDVALYFIAFNIEGSILVPTFEGKMISFSGATVLLLIAIGIALAGIIG
ncbi:MAG TPA: glycosyltransferase, partial [Miltoncostaeaceae bacterium]|nr:glycosyltransferase [Miltoncostaeaceae bacterium]